MIGDMSMLTIENARLRLNVLPDPGASIVSFEGKWNAAWVPLMRQTPPEVLAAPRSGMLASFNLIPWSNRLVGAAFDFAGAHYALRANTPQGYAIHGDGRDRPWRVTEHTAISLTCSLDSREFPDFNYPFPLRANIRYFLEKNTFGTMLTVQNIGDVPMPVGFGFHPYFNRGFGGTAVDEAELQLKVAGVYPPLAGMTSKPVAPVRSHLPADDRSGMFDVPVEMDFSTLVPVGTRDIDHCFGRWEGSATIAYPSSGVRLEFSCDAIFGHVIVYTPPGKPFFAVEPVTHANDGFNLYAQQLTGTGIRVLEPDTSLSGTFNITVAN
jgi:aldose 1-epimerase